MLSTHALATLDHSHKNWDQLLKKYVVIKDDYNRFGYKLLKSSSMDKQIFEAYLDELSSVSIADYKSFNNNQKLAFLINAYNAFTVDVILSRYPIKSILNIGFAGQGPWKKKNIDFLGSKMSLHQIEKDYLIDKFNAPEIHFAINCASIGCPSIQPYAFVAHEIDRQFDGSAKYFILNKSKNYYDSNNKVLKISKIFDWYADDFEKKFGSVKKYLAPIISQGDEKARNRILKAKINYFNYDWDLNE